MIKGRKLKSTDALWRKKAEKWKSCFKTKTFIRLKEEKCIKKDMKICDMKKKNVQEHKK